MQIAEKKDCKYPEDNIIQMQPDTYNSTKTRKSYILLPLSSSPLALALALALAPFPFTTP
jgi:hypothetical protein